MGIGAGKLTGIHVGGPFKRLEYILAGPPLSQVAIAEPLAVSGETCISPEAFVRATLCRCLCIERERERERERPTRRYIDLRQRGDNGAWLAVPHSTNAGGCKFLQIVGQRAEILKTKWRVNVCMTVFMRICPRQAMISHDCQGKLVSSLTQEYYATSIVKGEQTGPDADEKRAVRCEEHRAVKAQGCVNA